MSNFTASPSHGVTPLAVLFTATAVAGATYHWEFGDGGTGTGQSVVHTYNGGGTYSVAMTVIADGVATTFKQNAAVIVSRVGDSPADFDGYAPGASGNQGFPTGPAPLQVIFSGLDSACGFIWDYGDGKTEDLGKAGNPKAGHVYTMPGKYSPKLTADQYGPDGKPIARWGFGRTNYVTVT